MKVLIQLRHSPEVHAAAAAFAAVTPAVATTLPGVEVDPSFSPVQVPAVFPTEPGFALSLSHAVRFSMIPEQSTYLVRGTIPDEESAQRSATATAYANPNVVGLFSDPQIASTIVCPGDPAVGDEADVARLLDVKRLADAGMDGDGVFVSVVDTGVNLDYLRGKGRKVRYSGRRSWTPAGVPTAPFQHPVDHGTMCAYDVGIGAPDARLLDYAVLLSRTPGATAMAGLLSDAVAAYGRLLQLMSEPGYRARGMVVTNSWGMFSPFWDFPVGHPGNYSDNPAHPFNIVVASLESAGADILFAAGNCGRDCPDSRCEFQARPICGANSHPKVLSIAGIDTTKRRVGYSSQGPGRLDSRKPDVSAYTHFTGSVVFDPDPDGGTSAACPVAAGVVAAIRSRHPASKISPADLRSLIFKTADDLGGMGWDFDHGWGAIDPGALVEAIERPTAATRRRTRATSKPTRAASRRPATATKAARGAGRRSPPARRRSSAVKSS